MPYCTSKQWGKNKKWPDFQLTAAININTHPLLFSFDTTHFRNNIWPKNSVTYTHTFLLTPNRGSYSSSCPIILVLRHTPVIVNSNPMLPPCPIWKTIRIKRYQSKSSIYFRIITVYANLALKVHTVSSDFPALYRGD